MAIENHFNGYQAGFNNTGGIQNTCVGFQTGYSNTDGNNNVFIGYMAGYLETSSNKLYISNSNTISPLIYGEFDRGVATINDVLKLTPISTAPSPAEKGMIYFDDTSSQLKYFNGTVWIAL